MAELKVRLNPLPVLNGFIVGQNKLEAQHTAKRDAQQLEIQDLRQQLDHRSEEIRSLNSHIDGLKGVNEELKVRGCCVYAYPTDWESSACLCHNVGRNRRWQQLG
jgi:hypothetical protein